MNNYYFIYLDSFKQWKNAINPLFIASHTHCRGIHKDKFKNEEDFRKFIRKLNNNKIKPKSRHSQIVKDYDITEIKI